MAREHKDDRAVLTDQVAAGVISYGVSSYGYDVRVGDEFKVFTNVTTRWSTENFRLEIVRRHQGEVCIIPPILARRATIEYFRIRATSDVCLGSPPTHAAGIIVNVTPFEPEWEGT